jgi:hypothetical protein
MYDYPNYRRFVVLLTCFGSIFADYYGGKVLWNNDIVALQSFKIGSSGSLRLYNMDDLIRLTSGIELFSRIITQLTRSYSGR